jgi:hypothetical protein
MRSDSIQSSVQQQQLNGQQQLKGLQLLKLAWLAG